MPFWGRQNKQTNTQLQANQADSKKFVPGLHKDNQLVLAYTKGGWEHSPNGANFQVGGMQWGTLSTSPTLKLDNQYMLFHTSARHEGGG